jgi:hypothetical protein
MQITEVMEMEMLRPGDREATIRSGRNAFETFLQGGVCCIRGLLFSSASLQEGVL